MSVLHTESRGFKPLKEHKITHTFLFNSIIYVKFIGCRADKHHLSVVEPIKFPFVVELADTYVLGTYAERFVGSIPTERTNRLEIPDKNA